MVWMDKMDETEIESLIVIGGLSTFTAGGSWGLMAAQFWEIGSLYYVLCMGVFFICVCVPLFLMLYLKDRVEERIEAEKKPAEPEKVCPICGVPMKYSGNTLTMKNPASGRTMDVKVYNCTMCSHRTID